MTDKERLDLSVLRLRSPRNKIAVPRDDLRAGGAAADAIAALVKAGHLVLLDTAFLPHLAEDGRPDLASVLMCIFLVTPAGLAYLAQLEERARAA